MSEKEGLTNYVFIVSLSLISLLTLDYGHAMVIRDMCSCICYAQILENRNWYCNDYACGNLCFLYGSNDLVPINNFFNSDILYKSKLYDMFLATYCYWQFIFNEKSLIQ